MNCSTSRECLALWVEGDLPRTQVQEMEEHLSSCPACRTFRTELGDSQTRFRALIDEPVNVEALDKIRETVLVRTSRSKTAGDKRPLIPAWAYTAAAALLIALIGWTALRPSPEAEPVRTAQVEAVPEAPEVLPTPEVAPPEPVSQPEPVAVAALREDVAPATRPAVVEPETSVADATLTQTRSLTVKLLTDDPNVVIYWVVDQVGGME